MTTQQVSAYDNSNLVKFELGEGRDVRVTRGRPESAEHAASSRRWDTRKEKERSVFGLKQPTGVHPKKVRQTAQELTTSCGRTITGYCKLDVLLFDDDKLKYGVFNERPVNDSEAKSLSESFKHNFTPLKVETSIRIIGLSSQFPPNSLQVNPNAIDELQLVFLVHICDPL
ncbi:hypothetical protein BDN72DRAFT_931383 [Pluteus cervinus]|uniref:Uncharacterized protein n=1 Tax=Pluteus cervinus TaxID=181527 RepID=A0ACD3AAC2_9AGAR|nr:hypothetical protein BDN72DRAFT_931383 [Pluteus cervinus]